MQHIRPALMMIVLLSLLTGLAYPLLFTEMAQALFPYQAAGSLIVQDGRLIGSELIGQTFTSEKYFHGRPSAAGNGYDGVSSSGSNYGPISQKLKDRIATDAAKLAAENPRTPIPDDLVTASASGLDPDITPEGALFQVHRISRARNIPEKDLAVLVQKQIEGRLLGIIGEPHVNVLKLNLALDAYAQTMRAPAERDKLPPG